MPPRPPALPDELLEEIFLRLPPDHPECLVRASLASKLWLGRLTAPRFHGRYIEFHGAAPMLGFFHSSLPFVSEEILFVSTTKFWGCVPDHGNRRYSAYNALDCRHGRVLLGRSGVSDKLVVLDPITGSRRELDAPAYYGWYMAAVLCAVNGCDHRACHAGPSLVVSVGLEIVDGRCFAHAYVSLPEMGESSNPHSHLPQWSKLGSGLHLRSDASIQQMPPVLIQEALYFMLGYDNTYHVGILKYDLCSKCLSLIDVPLVKKYISHLTILVGMKDDSLGFIHQDGWTLNLWSRRMGSDNFGSWTECRVIYLNELLPVPKKRLRLIGSVEGRDIIFVTTKLGIYEINLNSLEWKKIWKKDHFRAIVPYMSFYYPQEKANPCDAAH